MAKLPAPPPPARLAATRPVVQRLAAGTLLWRVYFRGGAHPSAWSDFRAFGPTNARFDHHQHDAAGRPHVQDRKILYSAADGLSCLAELFQEARTIDRRRADPWLVGFEIAADLQLLDLTGVWPTRAGASQAIHSGPRSRARQWARAIHTAFPHLHGLWYRSFMHAGKPAQALCERAENRGCLPAAPLFHRPLADPHLDVALRNAGRDLGYALV